MPAEFDMKRHLQTVHKVEDVSQYDLTARCLKVKKNMPVRPSLTPVTSDKLTIAITRGLAVRSGSIVNTLLPRAKTENRDVSGASVTHPAYQRSQKPRTPVPHI